MAVFAAGFLTAGGTLCCIALVTELFRKATR